MSLTVVLTLNFYVAKNIVKPNIALRQARARYGIRVYRENYKP